jgi:lysozyme
MAEDFSDIFANYGDKSIEELGSSLLSRQAEINQKRAKEAKKSKRIGQALAVIGVGQQLFKGAYNKREKEIEEKQIFELSNNEAQAGRIQGMANVLNIFDEDKIKELAGPNREWATMSLDERTEALYNSPYKDTLEQTLKLPLDKVIEQANIFDDFSTFKSNKPLYRGAKNTAVRNIIRHFLENNRYQQFDTELRKLYGVPKEEFMSRAELLENAMSLTPHELTKLERAVFNREKQKYRNVGVFEGFKHAFQKIGRKQEENGRINLFRKINPEDVYGRIDDVITDLDITATMTTSIQKYMAELKGSERDAVLQANEDVSGQESVSVFVQNFSNDQNTRVKYNEKTPTAELLRMSGKKGRFDDFWEDISQDAIQSKAFIRDTLAIEKLMDMKPELAQSIYEAKYEKLYGKTASEETLKEFRSFMNDDVYKRNFAVMVTSGEGFKVEKAWYERGSEQYDGTGIVGRIEKGYSYDRFSGMLPSMLNEGINTPSESKTGGYSEDENWEKLDRKNKITVFDSHYNNIVTSQLSDRKKDILIEDLFSNVRHPDNLNPEDYAALKGKDLGDIATSSLFKVGRNILGTPSTSQAVGKTILDVLETSKDISQRTDKSLVEAKIELANLKEENAPTEQIEDAKFKVFQEQITKEPEAIYEKLPGLVTLIYEEEGLGKRKGGIGPQNTKVYKDSLGILTAGVGHALQFRDNDGNLQWVNKDEQYQEGYEVPVDVVKSWLIKDAKIANNDAVTKLQDVRPDLLDNKEIVTMVSSFYYQLGKARGDDFKKMWKAFEEGDGEKAYAEALDSVWAKEQTPERAKRFAEFIRDNV